MSQVFSADSVNLLTTVNTSTSAETTVITGNFLNPPFQNAKAIVSGFAVIQISTGTTSLSVRLRRNPNAENVVVGAVFNINVTVGTNQTAVVQLADAPVGPGPVQYALTLQLNGASANGVILIGSISAILISG